MTRPSRITRRRYRRDRQTQTGRTTVRGLAAAILIGLGALAGLVVIGGLGATAVYTALTDDLPAFADLRRQVEERVARPAQLYGWGDDGAPVLIDQLADPLGDGPRWLALADLPGRVVDATATAELPAGVSFDGRAALRALLNDAPADHSLARRLVWTHLAEPGRPGTVRRLRATLLAHRAAATYSREQLLEWHLNTAYYGRLAYGIEAAARAYFGKPAAELNLAEAAMLAVLPAAPDDDRTDIRRRQRALLAMMAEAGLIERGDQIEAGRAQLETSPARELAAVAPHFLQLVREELSDRFGPASLLGDGLVVYTTLDLALQRQASCLSRTHIGRLAGVVGPVLAADEVASCPALDLLLPAETSEAQVDEAAIVAIDPRTGQIRAMVGSLETPVNLAVDAPHQPGPLFGPFVYLTALSQGYTAATMMMDVKTTFGDYGPQNVDDQFHGPMRLRQALGNGYLVPAVEALNWVGVENAVRTAQSMGLTTLAADAPDVDLTLPSEGGAVTLLELTYAYGVLGKMGEMVGRPTDGRPSDVEALRPAVILRVEDGDGRLRYGYDPARRRILPAELAFLMNDMLSDGDARCQRYGCPNLLDLPGDRSAAARAGVSGDGREGWTVGYTPQLAVGVWLGNGDGRPMGQVSQTVAAPIWRALTAWALRDEPAVGWERPSSIVERPVCDPSGLLPTPHCPTVDEYFIAGTEPTVSDSIFQSFRINRETGRLATIYTPPELVESRVYAVYPERAAEWAEAQGIEPPPDTYDTIEPTAAGGEVAISLPRPFTFIRDRVQIIGDAGGDGFAYYRLAYFKGLDPLDVQVIAEADEPKEGDVLGAMDAGELSGLYTLLLTVVRQDGSFEEVSVHVVADNIPPEVRFLTPRTGQPVRVDDAPLALEVEATDDVAVERVEFFLDDAGVPFAIRGRRPFVAEWPVGEVGCYTFTATAVDAAGNEATAPPVRVCVRGEADG